MDIDFVRVKNAFEQMGVKDFDQHYSRLHTSHLFVQIETGAITELQFYDAIQKEAGTTLTDAQIEWAWNAILLSFREESIRFLQRLSQTYRLFLLSNTNAIHLKEINRRLQQQTGISDLRLLFEKLISLMKWENENRMNSSIGMCWKMPASYPKSLCLLMICPKI